MRRKLEARLARLEEQRQWTMEPTAMTTFELARRVALIMAIAEKGDDPEQMARARRIAELLRNNGNDNQN